MRFLVLYIPYHIAYLAFLNKKMRHIPLAIANG